jgi:hypothetical protein
MPYDGRRRLERASNAPFRPPTPARGPAAPALAAAAAAARVARVAVAVPVVRREGRAVQRREEAVQHLRCMPVAAAAAAPEASTWWETDREESVR